jgi:hypothetical protein
MQIDMLSRNLILAHALVNSFWENRWRRARGAAERKKRSDHGAGRVQYAAAPVAPRWRSTSLWKAPAAPR